LGNWWFWLIIIAIVLIIVVIIVMIVIKARKKQEPKKQETFARDGTFQPQGAEEAAIPPPEVFGPAPGPPVITPTYAPALPPAQPGPQAQTQPVAQGEMMDFSATPEEAAQQQKIEPNRTSPHPTTDRP